MATHVNQPGVSITMVTKYKQEQNDGGKMKECRLELNYNK